MKFLYIQLPSSRKLGFLLSIVFANIAIYLLYFKSLAITLTFLVVSFLFIILIFLKPNLFLPINTLRMKLNDSFSLIISHLFMGLIFFGLITPCAIIMRILGRDQLNLKQNNKNGNWVYRSKNKFQNNFKQQF
jgi:hypothetical protein